MRILFLGLNYAPEEIGIGRYSTGLCEELVSRGHSVEAVVGKPYYPSWKVPPEYRGNGARRSVENGVRLTRVPHYVPANPTGVKRIIHHTSFALSSMIPMLGAARSHRPDVVLTIAPSTIAAPMARLAARICGARTWLHIQDFEVGAALATGLVDKDSMIAHAAHAFEQMVISGFDHVSSISYEMCQKIGTYEVPHSRISEFRNWVEIGEIGPMENPSPYRQEWNISTPHVALYSGNIANKQGIDILIDVARELHYRDDLTFVICGNGPNRNALEAQAAGLTNIQFHDLQPMERLNELMNLATIHLLPQKASAADLVLPSKLTNMLASGRPVVATAHPQTGLAREVDGCGLLTPPEDCKAMTQAILALMDDPDLHRRCSLEAIETAAENWNKTEILDNFEGTLHGLARADQSFEKLERTL